MGVGRNCGEGKWVGPETVSNPDVWFGRKSNTDASRAPARMSQSMETRPLQTGMALRFPNVVIRGSLSPESDEMAFYQIASRDSPVGRIRPNNPRNLYSVSTCEGISKFRTTKKYDVQVVLFVASLSTEVKRGCNPPTRPIRSGGDKEQTGCNEPVCSLFAAFLIIPRANLPVTSPLSPRLGRGATGAPSAAGGLDSRDFAPRLAERARPVPRWWREWKWGEVRRYGTGQRLGDGRGGRGNLLDQGRVELIDRRNDDHVADGQAVEGRDGILVGRPESLAISGRPVVEQ